MWLSRLKFSLSFILLSFDCAGGSRLSLFEKKDVGKGGLVSLILSDKDGDFLLHEYFLS